MAEGEAAQRQRRAGAVHERAGVGGRRAVFVQHRAFGQRRPAVARLANLVHGDLRGGDVEKHRVAVGVRKAGGDGVGADAALEAAMRGDGNPPPLRVAEGQPDEPRRGRHFGIRADPPDMFVVAHRDRGDARRARLFDGERHAEPGGEVAESAPAVHHRRGRGFGHRARRAGGVDQAVAHPPDIDGDVAYPVAVVADEVRLDHETGDGLRVLAGEADRFEGVGAGPAQAFGAETRHCGFPLAGAAHSVAAAAGGQTASVSAPGPRGKRP